MSNYTIELGELVESGYKLPLDSYPIWDESKRSELNQMLINHYFFDEIGLETPDRFAQRLSTAMYEIMPYYNQRARAQLEELQTELKRVRKSTPAEITRTHTESGSERTTEGGKDSNASAANSFNAQSDTPGNSFSLALSASGSGADFSGYATQVGKTVQNGEASTTYGHTTERTFSGRKTEEKTTVAAEESTTDAEELDKTEYLARARALIINVEVEIINDKAISSLFMNLYY